MDIVTYALARKYADSVGTPSSEFLEVKALALQINKAKGYANYSSLVTELNSDAKTAYNVGQSFLIQTLEVPDLWVYSIENENIPYTYVDDTTIKNALESNGYFQCGYFKLSRLETLKQDLTNYISDSRMPTMTQIQYDSLSVKDSNTYYFIAD